MKPLTIFFVEGDKGRAELVVNILTNINDDNNLHHFGSGGELLHYLEMIHKNCDPLDLILLDINLPGVGGIETLKALRSKVLKKPIPIIMLSTSTNPEDINSCFALGANSYIARPSDVNDLSIKLEQVNQYWASTSELPSR